jgi:Rab5 GDP/GTP exchange factor
VSFIENLTAESLSMTTDEFNSLMSGEKVYTSAWESALMACENLHLISENKKTMQTLQKKNDDIFTEMKTLKEDMENYKVG